MDAVAEAAKEVGVVAACDTLNVSRATWYRSRKTEVGSRPPRRSARALSVVERETVLGVLHEERFADKAPAEVYATLLDEGRFLCSISTMYRILHDHAEVRERRDQRRRPDYAAPELLAERPNQVWSWDITKLKGPQKWSYFHLYVIIDIFSRYVVGWMIAPRESAGLAEKLIAETCARQGIAETVQAFRGQRRQVA